MSAANDPEFDICSANNCHGTPKEIWEVTIILPVPTTAAVAYCKQHSAIAHSDTTRYGVAIGGMTPVSTET